MTFRDDPAAYMREYRRRKKARGPASAKPPITFHAPKKDLSWSPNGGSLTARQIVNKRPVEPLVDASIPRGALAKINDETRAFLNAKIDAIGPGAVITKTNGRLDVITRAEADARPPAAMPAPSRSMVAIGGKPGRGLMPQGLGYGAPPDLAVATPYTHAKEFEAKAVAMFAAQAAETDALKRRVVALEAAADRRETSARSGDFALPAMRLFLLWAKLQGA